MARNRWIKPARLRATSRADVACSLRGMSDRADSYRSICRSVPTVILRWSRMRGAGKMTDDRRLLAQAAASAAQTGIDRDQAGLPVSM